MADVPVAPRIHVLIFHGLSQALGEGIVHAGLDSGLLSLESSEGDDGFPVCDKGLFHHMVFSPCYGIMTPSNIPVRIFQPTIDSDLFMIIEHDAERRKKRLAIVVCGWHFKRIATYKKLIHEGSLYDDMDTKYYIASHRDQEDISENVVHQLKNMGWAIIEFQNEGWDWGAYQEFVKWQKKNRELSYYYLFLHDDLIIKSHYFIKAFFSELSKGVKAIGNAFPYDEPMERAWPESSAHVLFWAETKNFFIRSKSWKCIRGSCLFTTREVVDTILATMPIRHGPHVGFGNWGALLFGGLIADRFGANAVSYLSNTLRNSPYLLEEYRGGVHEKIFDRFRLYIKSIIPFCMGRLLKGYVAPLLPTTGLKLHVGCGSRYMDGCLNIDADSDIADLKIDFFDLRLKMESVSVVLISRMMRRISYSEAELLLMRIFSFLQKGGQLIIEFPLPMKKASDNLNSSDDINVEELRGLLLKIGFNKIYREALRFSGLLKYRDTRVVAIK